MEQNFIENELVILTKQTLDIFLRQKNPSELISLYTFYYYTAKWQHTNSPKCTTEYVAKGLHWCKDKVIRVKKQLLEFGLIENMRYVDPKTKKVLGHYIKMNYIFKKETLNATQIPQNPDTGNKTSKPRFLKTVGVAFKGTNALSAINLNALSTNRDIVKTTVTSAENPNCETPNLETHPQYTLLIDSDPRTQKSYPLGLKSPTKDSSIINYSIKYKEESEEEKIDCQEVADAFNETCVSLPRVTKLTDKRKKAIKSILKKHSLEELKNIFKKVEDSSFLNGSSGKWSGATFDWLLKESNLIKVIEGNYDDKGKYNNFHGTPSYDIDEYEKLSDSHYSNLNHFFE